MPRRTWRGSRLWLLRNAETLQDVDTQQAKSTHKATIDADQAAIRGGENPTQLRNHYRTDGTAWLASRQVDIGNIIHTNDINPLTVLTQISHAP